MTEESIKNGFVMDKDKLVYYEDGEYLKISQSFKLASVACDRNHNNYTIVIEFETLDGHQVLKSLPVKVLYSVDGSELYQALVDSGFRLKTSKDAKKLFIAYLICEYEKTKKVIRVTDRIGWYDKTYVLPNQNYPHNSDIIYSGHDTRSFGTKGTLKEWQEEIGIYIPNNSRLMLSLALALSGPLLKILGAETLMVHYFGPSSTGKTTNLRLASSVWGGCEGHEDFSKQWRATSNALKSVAQSRSDSLLSLDEFEQLDGRSVGEVIYMMGNNKGKARLTGSIIQRDCFIWLLSLISTGEVTLEEKIKASGGRIMAGQDIRFLNIPTNCRHGIFDDIKGFSSGANLSRHINESCKKYYGTVGRVFLEKLVEMEESQIVEIYNDTRNKFQKNYAEFDFDGQIIRVIDKFSLFAVALELARLFGIIKISKTQGTEAMRECFEAWLENRETCGKYEDKKIIEQVMNFFQTNSESRFLTIYPAGTVSDSNHIRSLAGYKKLKGESYEYYIFSTVFRDEICLGLNRRQVINLLIKEEILIPDGNTEKPYKNMHIPKKGSPQFYHFSSKVFGEGNEFADQE